MANFPTRYFPGYPGPPQPPGLSYSPYRSQYPPGPMDSGYPAGGPLFSTEYPVPSAAPDTPKAKSPEKSEQVINERYRYYGYALLLLSLAALGVEIGNVAFTFNNFKFQNSFSAPYILTWIAPGIWGAIPVFLTGWMAVQVAGKNNRQVRLFALFCALSATVFTPAMISINAAEIIMYPSLPSGDTQPTYNNYVCYNLNVPATLSCPKFFLPLIVAVLGGVAFLLTFMVTLIFCCFWKPEDDNTETETETETETDTTKVIDEYYPYVPPYSPPYSPPNNQQMVPVFRPRPVFVPVPVYREAPPMIEPNMDFLRSYPIYRPVASRGFASAYNRQSYGNFPGVLPSLTGFGGGSAPNPAYMFS